MKKIVILHSINHYKKYSLLEKTFESKITILIIAVNIELRIFLSNRKIKFNIPEQYINEKQAEELDQISLNIGYNWHNDLFKFKEISLGRLVAWNNIYYFSRIIRNFHIILDIIGKECPFEIISFEDNDIFIREFNGILKYVCALRKIQFSKVPNEKYFDKKHKSIQNLKFLIKHFLDIYINSIPSQKPLRRLSIYFSSLLHKYYTIKLHEKNKNLKNILRIRPYKNEYFNSDLYKDNQIKILLLNEKATIIKILDNVKNTILRKKKGFHIFFEDYRKKIFIKKANDFVRDNLQKWNYYVNDSNFKSIFNYNGFSFWPLIKKYILKTIYFDFKRLIVNILTTFELCKNEKIDILIVNEDTIEFTKTIVTITTHSGIHSLVLQHGATGLFDNIGFLPLTAEKIAVWGETSKNNLMDNSLSNDRIVITGVPRFDRYIYLNRNEKLKIKIKKAVYNQFKIEYNKNLIVYTPSHIDFNIRFTGSHLNRWEVLKNYNCIFKAIKELPNSHLIVKLHPGDTISHIPIIMIKNLDINNASVVKDYKIENLYISCDCLITQWSTTGLEVMFFEKPLICTKFRKREYPVPYIANKAAFEVSNSNELITKLQIVFNNPNILKENQERFLKDYVYKIDGLSTKRVLNVIKNMI